MKIPRTRKLLFLSVLILTSLFGVSLVYIFFDVEGSALNVQHKPGVDVQNPATGVNPARFEPPRIIYTRFPPMEKRKRDKNNRPLRILITGGAGFIGSQLGVHFHRQGYEVILLDNMAFGYKDNLIVNGKRFGMFVLADVLDERTYKFYEGVDTVFHFAAISALPVCQQNPRYAADVNIAGAASALEASRLAGVRRFIFSSTSAVYENNSEPILVESLPVTPKLIYPLTKYQAELLVKSFGVSYGMDFVIMRFFNVYGPHQDVRRRSPPFTSYIARELVRGRRPVLHGTGKQQRDYVYIMDLINLAELLMTAARAKCEIVNVASGKSYSTREMFDMVAEITNRKDIKPYFQNAKSFWNAYSHLSKGSYPLDQNLIEGEVEKRVLGSYEKAKELVGWNPRISMKEGLEKIVDYIKSLNTADLDTETAWSLPIKEP
ncbi:uDP-glucose 4-epimerase [Trypanosoma theileri]|uniref:UDP-glucose 4-epimerase n=1 Tax=Trypanosoma theileri TaxID=67003 RepID=A0A1X0NTG2_9TRYP|nr:uDP-glucose 4-epimerase [Trypanosoma theileri]ORC87400.1 uDP-glucose 4-epimerase [Trypanosoma theileri]